MAQRIFYSLIVLFWVAMNGLLWHLEFGEGKEFGATVPAVLIWQKILTAPDNSSLEIHQRGKKVGYCRWTPNVGQEMATGKVGTEEAPVEGRIQQPTQYTIDFEGNLSWAGSTNRIRYHLHLAFAPDRKWQAMILRWSDRLGTWELQAQAASETLQARFHDDAMQWERTFSLRDLQHPEKLLSEFGIPWPVGMLAWSGPALGGSGGPHWIQNLSLGLRWQASHDWLKIGHSKGRVYRLQARLLDRYQAIVIVSRVGEILRVELPGNLLLVNDALTNL